MVGFDCRIFLLGEIPNPCFFLFEGIHNLRDLPKFIGFFIKFLRFDVTHAFECDWRFKNVEGDFLNNLDAGVVYH